MWLLSAALVVLVLSIAGLRWWQPKQSRGVREFLAIVRADAEVWELADAWRLGAHEEQRRG
jgi:hypothetical protein